MLEPDSNFLMRLISILGHSLFVIVFCKKTMSVVHASTRVCQSEMNLQHFHVGCCIVLPLLSYQISRNHFHLQTSQNLKNVMLH